jgi:hypothetical protein
LGITKTSQGLICLSKKTKDKIFTTIKVIYFIALIGVLLYTIVNAVKDYKHLKELEALSNDPVDYGYVGELEIPDLDVEVGLYDVFRATVDVNIQDLTDMKNKAVIYEQENTSFYIIGDHANQGFRVIRKAVPNETKAYVNGAEYVCVYNLTGKNMKTRLELDNGDNINVYNGKADLCMYTCQDSGGVNIYITMWKKVEK